MIGSQNQNAGKDLHLAWGSYSKFFRQSLGRKPFPTRHSVYLFRHSILIKMSALGPHPTLCVLSVGGSVKNKQPVMQAYPAAGGALPHVMKIFAPRGCGVGGLKYIDIRFVSRGVPGTIRSPRSRATPLYPRVDGGGGALQKIIRC